MRKTVGQKMSDDGLTFIKNKFDNYNVSFIKLSEGENTKYDGIFCGFIPRFNYVILKRENEDGFYIYVGDDIIVNLTKRKNNEA